VCKTATDNCGAYSARTSPAHDARYGLVLTPETRTLDALVVDYVRRDAALVLIEQAGPIARALPVALQPHLSRLLTIR
jgi:hypothetical protein